FGSVDPLRGADAVAQARSLARDYGVKGFKFHPTLQGFAPNDPAFYPLWAEIESLGVPALFHTGQTGIGAGLPGGRGLKLRLSDPMLVDDVAADFPALTVILAHPSVPWVASSISIATHKSNVYLDLSGWSPRYFPPQLVQYANTLIKTKVLFGSDHPMITTDRWLADFQAAGFREEVRPLILKANAAHLFGLT
ncbi:MAG: amidohydrolase, partial [Chloroflexi bacterium]|nr:amidohydrolase [Chloroflexota bacterium]